jgi:hypothetical protein
MRLSENHEFTLTFENSTEGGNEIDVFYHLVEKLHKESKKAGLKRMFNKEESQLISVLNEYINPKQPS